MTAFQLWLLVVALPGIGGFFFAAGVIFIGASLVVVILALGMRDYGRHESEPELYKKLIAKGRTLPVLAMLAFFLCSLIPSERQIYMIIGGQYATNLEGIAELPPEAIQAARAFLRQYQEDEK